MSSATSTASVTPCTWHPKQVDANPALWHDVELNLNSKCATWEFKTLSNTDAPFETSPSELLTSILGIVAIFRGPWEKASEGFSYPSTHVYYRKDVISHHLFRARLLSKRFAKLGADVLHLLSLKDRFAHYRKMILPASTAHHPSQLMTLRRSQHGFDRSHIDGIHSRLYQLFKKRRVPSATQFNAILCNRAGLYYCTDPENRTIDCARNWERYYARFLAINNHMSTALTVATSNRETLDNLFGAFKKPLRIVDRV